MIYIMGLSDGADEEMARALKPLSEQLKIDPFDQTMESVTQSIMSTSYCIQNGVTYQQSRDIYLKYLKDHPELRHKTAQSLYLDALKLSFPCTLSK